MKCRSTRGTRGDHEAARLEYQRSKRPDSVIGRQAGTASRARRRRFRRSLASVLPQDVSDELVRNQESQGQAFNESQRSDRAASRRRDSIGGTMLAAAPVAAMAGPAAPLVFGGAAGLSTGNQALTQATDAGLSGEQRIGHAADAGRLKPRLGVFSKVLRHAGYNAFREPSAHESSQSAAKIGISPPVGWRKRESKKCRKN